MALAAPGWRQDVKPLLLPCKALLGKEVTAPLPEGEGNLNKELIYEDETATFIKEMT